MKDNYSVRLEVEYLNLSDCSVDLEVLAFNSGRTVGSVSGGARGVDRPKSSVYGDGRLDVEVEVETSSTDCLVICIYILSVSHLLASAST